MEKQNDQEGIRLKLCNNCLVNSKAMCTPISIAHCVGSYEEKISNVSFVEINKINDLSLVRHDPEKGFIYREIPWKPK